MADNREPPPLFDAVDINSKSNDEDDDEYFFVSAASNVHHPQEQSLLNGLSETEPNVLQSPQQNINESTPLFEPEKTETAEEKLSSRKNQPSTQPLDQSMYESASLFEPEKTETAEGKLSSKKNLTTSQPLDQSMYESASLFEPEKTETAEVKLPSKKSLPSTQPLDQTMYESVSLFEPEKTETAEVKLPSRTFLPSTQSLEEVETENYDDFLEIKVTEPQKIGDGMGSYMAYKVTTKTNMPKFRKNQFTVMRRFSDFLGLHEKLVEKYLRSGRIIPPAPEKSLVGTTKVKISNQGEPGVPSEFIEKRRAALERFMARTAAHPILSADPDFREFLEADMELPRATNTSALSSAGVLRLFNKFGETVNKITFKMEENDPWFEEKAQQIENLDIQLRKLHASVESLVLHRRDLASLTSSFAKSAAMLSNCEEHTSLSRALSQLAEVEEKVECLHNDQANADFSTLCELLKDYVALIGAIKDVFHERVKVYQNWQHAQLMLTKKRELKSKFELQERRDKSMQVAAEVAEWSSKVERGQEEFDNISQMIKKEMERFEVNRVRDFKTIIIQYLETLMNQQQELVKYWETFLPEARAIA